MPSKRFANTAPSKGFGLPSKEFAAAVRGEEAATTLCLDAMILDAHSHDIHRRNAIACVSPEAFAPEEGQYYCVGIHPWDSENVSASALRLLHEVAAHPQVVAVGEAGIDKLKGASIEKQMEIFAMQAEIASRLHKPLIVHAVKSLDEILAAKKREHPPVPWIWHGFRGNRHTAETLVKHGFLLSFGERFNAEAVVATPDNALLVETDMSQLPIEKIIEKIASAKGISPHALTQIIASNLHAVMPPDIKNR